MRTRSLAAAGSGRFPVGGYPPRLRRIMDNQGERPPQRRTSDAQLHWNIGPHHHCSSRPSPVSARRSLQALLSCQHVPAFGAWVCMHPRLVARPHDSVRENRRVALCCGKLERPDDGDSLTAPRGSVSGPEFREPHSPVFFHHNPGRTLGRLRSLPVWKRAQMPVDGCSTEMKCRHRADVEAAKLRSLFPWRHVDACHFGQVLVAGRGGLLSTQVANWYDLMGDEAQYERPDEWRSGHVRSPGEEVRSCKLWLTSPPNDLRISCGRSCPPPHKPTFLSGATGCYASAAARWAPAGHHQGIRTPLAVRAVKQW